MANARRIALVLVIVLLICDGALLALVKMNGPKGGGSSFNLIAQEDKVDKVNKVKAALEKEGFTAVTSEGTKKNRTVDGYRVLLRSNKSAVDPLFQDLSHHKIPVKKIEEGKALQVTKLFKSKKLAQQEADRLRIYGFKVEENYKETEVKCTRIEVKNLDSEKTDKAKKIFTDNKVTVESVAATGETPGATGTP